MKNKIAIVGAGSAGCITALHYYYYGRDTFDISIYHSPEEHPIERVGQGTVPGVVKLIGNTLDFSWYKNPIDSTYKTGIMYEDWGKKQDKIFHPFNMNQMSMHFIPQKLSNTTLESGFFEVIEKTITDPEKEIDADFIFDCRGRHNRDDSNYDTLINPLNSVLLYKKDGIDQELEYTRSVATPNGWTFVIPNIDSVSYGYLYNNTITSLEEAKNDFLERFGLPDIDDKLTFENYMARNIFVGERTILQGNMFGFIEPMEATSLALYQEICRHVWDVMFGVGPASVYNSAVRSKMKEIETFILWHYQNGSKYDTPFWDYAKSLPFNPDEKFNNKLEESRYMDDLESEKSICYLWWNAKNFSYWDRDTSFNH